MKHIQTRHHTRTVPAEPNLKKLGYALAIGSVLFDGTYSALAKGLTPFLSPITLLVLSESLTASFVVITLGLFPLMKAIRLISRRKILIGCLIGILNSAIAPLLWYQGLSQTTAVNAAMISSCEILFGLLFSYVLLSERVNRSQMLGAAIVLGGIGIIVVGTSHESFGIHVGDALIIMGSAIFSLGTIIFKKYLTSEDPEVALFIRNMSGIFTMSVISALIGHALYPEISSFPMHKVVSLLAFAFFSRYLNITLLYSSLDKLSAVSVSLIQNAISPLAGMTFAYLILGEQITTVHILGAIFIVFGLMLEHLSSVTAAGIVRKVLRFDFSYQPQ